MSEEGTPTRFGGFQPSPLDRVQGRTSSLCCAHIVDRPGSDDEDHEARFVHAEYMPVSRMWMARWISGEATITMVASMAVISTPVTKTNKAKLGRDAGGGFGSVRPQCWRPRRRTPSGGPGSGVRTRRSCRVGDTNVFRIIRGPPVGFVGTMARICIPNVNEQGPLALATSVARRKNG